jgi:hypothetical protein
MSYLVILRAKSPQLAKRSRMKWGERASDILKTTAIITEQGITAINRNEGNAGTKHRQSGRIRIADRHEKTRPKYSLSFENQALSLNFSQVFELVEGFAPFPPRRIGT